ncbi:TonB-dependent receptor [Ferrimonas sp.]|uniref:TonB-dependent receptor n=1 Tax=Ferrimonas sp. TaxID=2080861 RepID=UPI003A8E23B0
MMQSIVSRAVKGAMLGTLASATLISNVAYAEEGADVERIEVTGSRISREGAITPTPVTVITGETLTNTGAVNIAEALNELPALASTFSMASSGSYIGTAGLSVLDLRGMGTERTLVLVDGKRHVSSSAGDSRVDINTIPTVWVESVEIITGGASAVYGADAVTGVVNFRLKKDITGFNISAVAGEADDSGYDNQKLALSYGRDFDDGRGNAAISVEYSQQSELSALDRDQTKDSWTTIKGDDTVRRWVQGGYYAINNAGAIYGPWNGLSDSYTFNSKGELVKQDLGDTVDGTKCVGPCDYENLRQWELLQPEFDRTTVNFKTNYDITEDLNAYFEAKWSQTNATNSGQPAFFFGSLDIKRDNAFIQDDLAKLMDDNDLDSVTMSRFINDLGPRIEEDERTTQRYVVGIEGVVFEEWDLEAYGTYGKTENERVNKNNLIRSKFAYGVDSILVDGEAVCRDETARANGCVAVNLFGDGAVTQEMADYISTTSVGTATVEQYVFGANLTNSYLFDVPAGSVGFATGVEYRKEKMETKEDALAASGDTFFNAFPNEKADYDVSEIYAEFNVPLLTDLPMIQDLTMEAAARYSDYSTTGGTTSWKLGLDWVVFDDLRFRATLATAFRAPNLGEFYGAPTQNYFRFTDTCKSSELATLSPEQRAIRAANCAAMGVPADFDSDYDGSSLEGVNQGNSNLEPEESESYTIGLVYQPDFVDSLTITLDYWNIEITDAISGIGAQNIIDRCVDNPGGINNEYCALISRDPVTHELNNLINTSTNVAKQEASGVDFEIGYDTELGEGDLRTTLIGTYLIERNEYAFQDDPSVKEEFAGTVGEAEWQANLTTTYTISDWDFAWKLRYLDGVDVYTPQYADDYSKPYSDLMSYGTYVVNDVLMHYTWDNGIKVGFGIDNLFDRDLPGHSMGNGTGSASYDNIGRFYYVTFDYAM